LATFWDAKERNVIPRWRDFRSTLEVGELSSLRAPRTASPKRIETSGLEFDWSQNRSLSFAGDLISGAWISGNLSVAREAAEFVLESKATVGESLLGLATAVLDRLNSKAPAESISGSLDQETRALIARYRRRLRSAPHDAIGWVDLSLLHAQVGSTERAKRAMLVGLTLAPENRFVLRSAARFFLHASEPQRAHELLKRSSLVRSDPWIASAEIAVATVTKRIPVGLDIAKNWLGSRQFAPEDSTELAAAFATVEVHSGNVKRAKKYLRYGLERPNENSLAQAQWLSNEVGGSVRDVKVEEFAVPRSFEASACQAFFGLDWSASTLSSVKWLRDEPFARRPVEMAAYTAFLMEDFESGEHLIRLGLVANPNHGIFHISLAFSLASRNRLDEAEAELQRIKPPFDPPMGMLLTANLGLIHFRRGDPETGRALYAEAVEDGLHRKDEINVTAALIYWAREELLAETNLAAPVLERASEWAKRQVMPQYKWMVDQLELRLRKQGSDKTARIITP